MGLIPFDAGTAGNQNDNIGRGFLLYLQVVAVVQGISWGEAGTASQEDLAAMDSIVMICFASVITTVTALSFMELRRIRRRLETTGAAQSGKPGSAAGG